MPEVHRKEIIGQENLQSYFQNEVTKRWKQLERKYSNAKGRILLALLLMLTDISHTLKRGDEIDQADYLRLPMLLNTLDELLIHGWNIIEHRLPIEIQTYIDQVVHEFLPLGYIKNRAMESMAFQEENLVLEERMKPHELPLLSEPAFNDWTEHFTSDGAWHDFYYSRSERFRELSDVLKEEFHMEYGITPQQLIAFEFAMEKTAREQRDLGGNLPLPFDPEKLLAEMIRIMSREGPIEEEVARRILGELEYAPGKHWARSPLVEVRIGQEVRYTPILPSMFIEGVISTAWLEHFKKSTRGSRFQGMINNDWGKRFEEYVRETLRLHTNLTVNPGHLKIKKKRYPNLIDCVLNPMPEIDVVAQSKDTVYLVSCKALNESISIRLLLTFYLFDYKTFAKKIELDLQYAEEISVLAKCIRKSTDFLKDRGFGCKEIVPLLVTPDLEPLGIESVRQWCLDMKIAHSIPEARVIQAKALRDFHFD